MNDSETSKSINGWESQTTKDPLDGWYYLVGDKTCGPSTAEEIRNQIASGAIPDGTFVFREGMGDWAKARTLPEFACLSSPSPGRATGTIAAENAKTKVPIASSEIKAPTLNSGRAKPAFISKGIIISVLATILAIGLAGVTIHRLEREKAERLAFEARQQEEAKQKEAVRLAEEGRIAMERLREKARLEEDEKEAQRKLDAVKKQRASERVGFDRHLRALENAPIRSQARISELNWAMNSARALQLTSSVPEPSVGNKQKVVELVEYVRNKLPDENVTPVVQTPTRFGYSSEELCWIYQVGGYEATLFLPEDLDPTSAQIVTKSDHGHQLVLVTFSTINSRKRIIYLDSSNWSIQVINKLTFFCGRGASEQDAERIGKALAALILAYGGQSEIVN